MPLREFERPRPEFEKESNNKTPSANISRRDFLRGLGGAGVIEALTPESAEASMREYKTGDMAGYAFSNLYTEYTGIVGRVPEVVKIDFENRLKSLWAKKNHRSDNNRVVVETGNQLVREYQTKKHTLMDVGKYTSEVNGIEEGLKKNFDWDQYAGIKRLTSEELKLAKAICSDFHGKDLVAYALTELMPSKNGVLNKRVLHFLLKSAGREYVEAIPALYDPKTSFGPYQFTEYALFDSKGVRRGASIPNQALKSGRIAGSVSMLRGADHHKAAYLFLVDNLTNLVARATQKQFAVLKKIKSSKHSDLLAYAATAHHGPGVALQNARRWLDNSARLPYEASCGKAYRLYAEKTKANYSALGS